MSNMSITSLDATKNGSSTNTTDPTTSALGNALTQADFLKLLVAQMSAQDPLNPQSNTEFASQMAQFSALQTSQSTQMQVAKLNSAQQIAQANELIGRTVTLQAANGAVTQGNVSSVQLSNNVPFLVVNGAWYDLSQVIGITANPILNPTNPSGPSAPSAPKQAPARPIVPPDTRL